MEQHGKGLYSLVFIEQPLLQLSDKVLNKALDPVSSWELQSLLCRFTILFDVPIGLPPLKSHDHQIPLKDEHQIVKVRPYRYPAIQKTEIEKMIKEMKDTGIIRDSTNPFASLVILVKKKDGSWRMCVDYR